MKKSLRTILAALLALCFMFAFAASAGAVEAVNELIGQLETVDYGNLIEYDYINKTERVIPMDSIPDYAATTTTTYELPRMASELARLAEMTEMNASMEGGASTFSIIDSSKPFVRTPPKTGNVYNSPYSGVVFLRLGIDIDGDGLTNIFSRGTGFMVAPDVMVTAGHCIDHPDFVNDAEKSIVEVRIYPYVHGAMMPSWWYDESYIYPASWICYEYSAALRDETANYYNYDWCVMKLQEPITNAYNFACSLNTSDILTQEISISGYPHCTDVNCTKNICAAEDGYQVTSTGNVLNLTDYQIQYTNNVVKGNSGGPICSSSTKICYGICTYGQNAYNGGTRFTRTIYNAISYYINE